MTETPKTEPSSEEIVDLEEQAGPTDDEDIYELEHLRKLFVGGLSGDTTEAGLKAFYGKWGKVVDAVVMREPATKRSRGFGFVTYTKVSSVDEAQKNRPHVIDGKTVDPKRALPRPQRETRAPNISVKKLFIGGLKENHDEQCLEEYFSQFGNVISVNILTDKITGKRRGFAFIEYDDYDSVDKAILQKVHCIKYVVIDVKKSVYKEGSSEEKVSENDKNGEKQVQGGQKQLQGGQRQVQGGQRQVQVGQKPNSRPPAAQRPMPPYQPGPPASYPQGAPYNYWGPPQQPAPPQYGPYPQPPTNAWNAQNGWNGWNAGPPAPQGSAPPNNWYPPNQWQPRSGPAPGGMPANGPAPPANWNGPPSGPPQQQGAPANFGTGYQQNYGGGPTKHNAPNPNNRMHPYGPPQNSNYANGNQPPPPQGFNGYGPPVGPPINNAAQMAGKFRR